jgi:hypothetical protein
MKSLHCILLACGIILAAHIFCSGTSTSVNSTVTKSLNYSPTVSGLEKNPLKGFIPNIMNTSAFPYSMERFYIPLSDIMTADNTFNWTKLETQIAQIAARGHQATFRIYVDYPNRVSGIPPYLISAGLATYSYTDSGNTTSVSPDYGDARLIKAFTDCIKALGAKYDNDPRIGFITAGFYGFWGEWHVHSHPTAGEPAGWVMSQANKELLLSTYLSSFKNTIILIRYPNITSDTVLKKSFGYHDDSFAYSTIGTASYYFWVLMTVAGITDIWKTYPIGGEVRPEIQSTVWDNWPNTTGQDVSTCITTTHATWMIDSANFSSSPLLTAAQYANALRAHRMLGYELYVSSVSADPQNGCMNISVTMENRGVAPFYYSWPMELALTDSDGNIISRTTTGWQLKSVLPGTPVTFTSIMNIPSVSGNKLLMRVINPLTNGNPLRFANETQDTVLSGWLTLL